jgi:hypothetical protein
MMEHSQHRKTNPLVLVALALLLLIGTQYVSYIICECDSCDDLVCQDWSCCLCASAPTCVLTVSACLQPNQILIGLISPLHDDGRAPETAFELDRPPRSVTA